jgi:PAS domain S-box-containing protein
MAEHFDRTVWLVDGGASQLAPKESTYGVAFTSGPTHVVREANAAFCRFAGQPRNALLDRSLAIPFEPGRTGDDVRRLLDQVFDTRVADFRADVPQPPMSPTSESRRYFTLIVSPVVTGGTGELGLKLEVLDTSAQVQVREAREEAARNAQLANESLLLAGLREQETAELAQREAERWSALVANLTEGVTVLDGAGHPILVNPIGRRLLGLGSEGALPAEYVIGKLETLAGDEVPPSRHPGRRALAGERFTGEELFVVGQDGERRRLVFAGSAVHDDAGNVDLAINVYRDVTELRQLEQTREDYVALISHDLRNPLQALLGHAQLLLRAEQGAAAGETSRITKSAGVILKVARRLQGMVEDLYQSSQLESGDIILRRELVPVTEVVADLLDRVGTPEDRARIKVIAAPALPSVPIDVARMERALVNLLSNALKYSGPSSEVTLELSRTADEVLLAVRDRGPGISAADLPFVFEKYRRARKTAQCEGLGLGLYITRRIVEAHGGRLSVESELGHGSTFRVALPITVPDAAPGPGADHASTRRTSRTTR